MFKRTIIPGLLALTVLVGLANLGAGGVQAQGSGQLTDESLAQTLTGLGYEPKKLGSGYLVSIKREDWTFYIQYVLSSDKTKLGFNSNLGSVEQPENVAAANWMELLVANGNIDPSFFFFDKNQKKLYLHRVLDNREITPAYLRQQTDSFCNNIKETGDAWKFTK
jgi:hypothetical protein